MNTGYSIKKDTAGYLLENYDNYEISGEYTEINSASISTSADDANQHALYNVKSILKPVNIFLIIIGWSPIIVAQHKKKRYLVAKVWNRIWPVIVFLLLTSTVLLQIVSCDKRNEYYSEPENTSNTQLLHACLRNLISYYIFPTVLILISYTYMLYLIRRQYSEHFENMMERVFLLYTQKRGRLSQTTLRRTVRLFFVVAITWLLYSIILLVIKSVVNIILEQRDLFELIELVQSPMVTEHTKIEILLILLEPIPIVIYDLFYVSQLLSYSIQAQLLIYYFNGINDSIKFNEVKLQDGIKEIEHAAEILSTINGKVAISVSLVMINISMFIINTFHQLWNSVHGELNQLAVAYEVLDLIRWIVILYVPLFQAMLITVNAKRIMKLGLFLKTRPFGYVETSQEDLNYFQLYTSNLKLRGKLFGIPVRPRGVALFILILLFAAVLWVGFDPNLGKVYWV